MARKMSLVPSDVLQNLQRKQSIDTSATSQQLMNLDKEMQSVMNQELPASVKSKKYIETLERYILFHRKKSDEPDALVRVMADSKTPEVGQNGSDTGAAVSSPITTKSDGTKSDGQNDNNTGVTKPAVKASDKPMVHALTSIPKTQRIKAEHLLNMMQTFPDVLDINAKGEISYKGNTVRNSNIVDLLNSFTSPFARSKSVTGTHDFAKALADMNAPETLISNKSNRELVQQFKTGVPSVATPPGEKPTRGGTKRPKERNLYMEYNNSGSNNNSSRQSPGNRTKLRSANRKNRRLEKDTSSSEWLDLY